MNHDHHFSGWPVAVSWIANAVLFLTAGLNPLQVLALLLTIGYTIHRWWLMNKRGNPTE